MEEYIFDTGRKNQSPIKKVGAIPKETTIIIFGDRYDHPIIKETIPKTVWSISFGQSFSQSIKPFTFSNNIKELLFDMNYKAFIHDNVFPPYLETLSIHYKSLMCQKNKLPETLTNLTLFFDKEDDLTYIPPQIKNLTFFNFNRNIKKDILPENLEKLNLGNNYNIRIRQNILPKKLKILYFGKFYNKTIKYGILPDSLEEIYFVPLQTTKKINNRIVYISNYSKFQKKILPFSIPLNVKKIFFPNTYNKKIYKDSLPHNLEILSVGSWFMHQLTKETIPNTLKYLKISHLKSNDYLPETLKTLHLDYSSKKQNIPLSITHLIYDYLDEDDIPNLPLTLEKLQINFIDKKSINIKLPFGCLFVDKFDNPIVPE